MEKIDLTPRLETVAHLVPRGAKLADIGCDHGKLTIHLLSEGVIASAIAADIREGPLSHARKNAAEHGVAEFISFRLTAGLMGISPDTCDTIAIAGMGGETIADIMREAEWTKRGAHSLLLQPMTMLPSLRQFLWANGYVIESEHICREDKRFYVVMQVRGGGTAQRKTRTECIISKALLRDACAVEYLRFLLHTEEKALCGLKKANSPLEVEIQEKQQGINIIREALEVLE